MSAAVGVTARKYRWKVGGNTRHRLRGSVFLMNLGKSHQGPVHVSAADRRRHFHLVGQTGTGKSTLLGNMVAQDLAEGEGVCVIDPHGDLAEEVLALIPDSRAHELVYINPSDMAWPVGFNPLDGIPLELRDKAALNILGVFRHIWHLDEERTPWVLRLLWNSARALMDYRDGATLLGITRMLTDTRYRESVAEQCTNEVARKFWLEEFDRMEPKEIERTLISLKTRIERLNATAALRNMLGQTRSTFDLRKMMDEGRILVVNLSKGKLGEEDSHLLGALLVSSIYQAAMSRADLPMAERRPFHLYVDEFQNFASDSFAGILSEARKYGLTLTLAHQYLSQVPDNLLDAVLGNTGNVVCFRVGAEDGALLGRHLGVLPQELSGLSNHFAWCRLLVKGDPSNPVRIETDAPAEAVNHRVSQMMQNSRVRFGKERRKVERNIRAFLNPRSPEVRGRGNRPSRRIAR